MGRSLKVPVSAGFVAARLGLLVQGDSSYEIFSVDAADASVLGSLCFAKNAAWALRAHADALLLTSKENWVAGQRAALLSAQPRLDFARTLEFLEQEIGFVWSNVDPDIHPSVRVGKNVVLGRGVRIGAHTVLHHNVVIGDEVIIGERCVIKSCAVIGEEGFGFERSMDGSAIRLPHIGTVLIGNDVEVGSLTTVCRGTLGNTVLCDGCKIDDHVHIAHNVEVGTDAFVIACAEISGGVKIGPRAWISPQATVLNQLTLGADCVVGLGGVVIKSVADGTTVVGNPARVLNRS